MTATFETAWYFYFILTTPWQFCTVLVLQLKCRVAPIQKSPSSQYFIFHNQISNLLLNYLLIGQHLLSIKILTIILLSSLTFLIGVAQTASGY